MVKRPQIRTRAGQLTWLQVLSLALSGVFFVMGSMLPALALLLVATLFGAAAAIRRVRDARQSHPELFRQRRRR